MGYVFTQCRNGLSSVAEGERVSKDSTIGSLFYGDVSDDSIKELTVVDNKIKKTKTEKK